MSHAMVDAMVYQNSASYVPLSPMVERLHRLPRRILTNATITTVIKDNRHNGWYWLVVPQTMVEKRAP